MPEKRKREAGAAEDTPSKRVKSSAVAQSDTETAKEVIFIPRILVPFKSLTNEQVPNPSNATSSSDNSASPVSYHNYEVDVESDWAQQNQLQGLPGAEVFYQPDVSQYPGHLWKGV
jgi:hypothetical protein